MRHSLSTGTIVVVLALTACVADEGPADKVGVKTDPDAGYAVDTMEEDQDNAYVRQKDPGYCVERAPRYMM
jgi:hypothetical protein